MFVHTDAIESGGGGPDAVGIFDFSLSGLGPCKDETPQAEACATGAALFRSVWDGLQFVRGDRLRYHEFYCGNASGSSQRT